MEGALATQTFHKNQHAYRNGSSTETALHAIMHTIEKSLHYKKVCEALYIRRVIPTLVKSALETTRWTSEVVLRAAVVHPAYGAEL